MQDYNCPECDAAGQVDSNIIEGEILICSDCSVELEIIKLDPLEIDLAPEVEEDWGE